MDCKFKWINYMMEVMGNVDLKRRELKINWGRSMNFVHIKIGD